MSRPRALTDEQAQALVNEIHRGVPKERIAKYFGVSTDMVHRIGSGRSYSDVTGLQIVKHDASNCQQCEHGDARDRNVDRVRDLIADVECVSCHTETQRSVGVVLNSRGLVRCKKCDRRRK